MQRELRWLIRILDIIANSSGFEVMRRMFMLTRPGTSEPVENFKTRKHLTPEMLQIHDDAKRNVGTDTM